MAVFRPIVHDWVESGRPSLEDRVRARLREQPTVVSARRVNISSLGRALSGTKAGRSTKIRGGAFVPGPVSGLL